MYNSYQQANQHETIGGIQTLSAYLLQLDDSSGGYNLLCVSALLSGTCCSTIAMGSFCAGRASCEIDL
jgi:hypothetical protein